MFNRRHRLLNFLRPNHRGTRAGQTEREPNVTLSLTGKSVRHGRSLISWHRRGRSSSSPSAFSIVPTFVPTDPPRSDCSRCSHREPTDPCSIQDCRAESRSVKLGMCFWSSSRRSHFNVTDELRDALMLMPTKGRYDRLYIVCATTTVMSNLKQQTTRRKSAAGPLPTFQSTRHFPVSPQTQA